ncbi:MAG TPA: Uma2 family endonuclease [Gammaproteobacteria bacterium]|nr:Uma2 family endonuclease [Gammaproteobacteria bacterium]
MIARAKCVDRGDEPREDHYVHLRGVTWDDYLRLLEIRGERSTPRMTYLEGTLEIMSPSRSHDEIKSYIGRLVEAWCLERNVEFTPYGSWTLKSKRDERGAEADECYVFGPNPKAKRRPDLAIEVVWTSGGIDKLEVYRKLGVRELWSATIARRCGRGRLRLSSLEPTQARDPHSCRSASMASMRDARRAGIQLAATAAASSMAADAAKVAGSAAPTP